MSRIDKINSLLIKELGQAILREIEMENCLITVTYVDCSPDLSQAKIGISVLPDNQTGTALHKIRNNSKLLRSLLKKKLSLKIVPKLIFIPDDRERNAAEIENIINSLHN